VLPLSLNFFQLKSTLVESKSVNLIISKNLRLRFHILSKQRVALKKTCFRLKFYFQMLLLSHLSKRSTHTKHKLLWRKIPYIQQIYFRQWNGKWKQNFLADLLPCIWCFILWSWGRGEWQLNISIRSKVVKVRFFTRRSTDALLISLILRISW